MNRRQHLRGALQFTKPFTPALSLLPAVGLGEQQGGPDGEAEVKPPTCRNYPGPFITWVTEWPQGLTARAYRNTGRYEHSHPSKTPNSWGYRLLEWLDHIWRTGEVG